MAEFLNTDLADLLQGTTADDSFVIAFPAIGAGDDLIFGGGGRDLIEGGTGNDMIDTGPGRATIYGGDGNDQIRIMGLQAQLVDGGDGFDILSFVQARGLTIDMATGRAGLIRFQGIERVGGTYLDDSILGGTGNDTLYGEGGADLLKGGRGDDNLAGDSFSETDADRMFGGGGRDLMFSTGHGDRAFGGRGSDTVWLFNEADQKVVLGGGRRTVDLGGNGEVVFRSIESWRSGAGNDELYGDRRANTLTGDAGNDLLFGGAGNDLIYGGEGNDIIYGGTGDNGAFGGNGDDRFVFSDQRIGLTNISSIYGFEPGKDTIDLSDLSVGGRALSLTYIGAAAFSAGVDQVRFDGTRLQVQAAGETALVLNVGLAAAGDIGGDLIL